VGGGGEGGEVVVSWGSLRRGAWGARPLASSALLFFPLLSPLCFSILCGGSFHYFYSF